MNTPNDELDLLRQLRRLPREREPARDLWQGIEARLPGQQARATTRRARFVPTTLAAAMALLAVVGVWKLLSTDVLVTPAADSATLVQRSPDRLLQREAQALHVEYAAAMSALGPVPASVADSGALAELDANADVLRDAIATRPDATFLLERLRHVYAARLDLTRRGVIG